MTIDHFLSEIQQITINEQDGTYIDDIPFLDFVEHCKSLPHWQNQLDRENSSFLKMIKMKGQFLKYDAPEEQLENNAEVMTLDVQIQENIDIFSLKIMALLICRGDSKDKAGILFELLKGNSKSYMNKKEDNGSFVFSLGDDSSKNAARDKLIWSSSRLRKAIYKIVFFSELLPKLVA